MSLFGRIKNIIKSNINTSDDIEEIDLGSYNDTYYDDAKDTKVGSEPEDAKYYKVLEVEYGADFNKIKAGYRKLLKKYHPDLFNNDPKKLEAAKAVTKKINEAYSYFERKYL